MSEPFTPLFAGRPAAKLQTLRVEVMSADKLAVPSRASDAAEPNGAVPDHAVCGDGAPVRVTLEKDGETVIGVRIDCGCGQVIQLACVY